MGWAAAGLAGVGLEVAGSAVAAGWAVADWAAAGLEVVGSAVTDSEAEPVGSADAEEGLAVQKCRAP